MKPIFLKLILWISVLGMFGVTHAFAAENLKNSSTRFLTEKYTGEKISLNFQNISVRAILQLLAEFMHKNIIVNDSVKGNITLHLDDIPWDQALDFILQTQGLAKREIDNIVIIAPASEILQQEQSELKAKQQLQALAPLYTQAFQINYGNVEQYYTMLKDPANTLLSARGRVVRLDSANTLIIEDTADKLQEISKIFKTMDLPVKQVLIEARIVFVNRNFQRNLGVVWGSTATTQAGIFKGFNLDLAAPNIGNYGAGSLALGKVMGGVALNLELQALEAEGQGEIVSSPQVITSNNMKALIEQGTQIPYTVSAANGATAIQLVDAVLKLEVTPQITPNNKINMELVVQQDKPGVAATANVQPPIDTRKIVTNILVDNGETIVLGGVYEVTKTNTVTRIPFFGSLPVIGNLFKATAVRDSKSELLIFITSKIIDDGAHISNGHKS